MNIKLSLSAIAIAALSTLFIGCSSDNAAATAASSSLAGGSKGTLVGTTIVQGDGSGVTDSTGIATIVGGTGTVLESQLDGIDLSTNAAPTRKMVGSTLITDANGNPIVNAFTDMAIKTYGTADVNASMASLATDLNISQASMSEVIGVTSEDNKLEKLSRVIFDLVTIFVDTDGNVSGLKTAMDSSTDGNLTSVLDALVAGSSSDLNATAAANTVDDDTISGATMAASDGNYTTANLNNNRVTYSNVLVLDDNTTTSIPANDIATLSRFYDVNNSVSITASNDTNETGTFIFSIKNTSTDTIYSAASYAVKLTNLVVTKVNQYITSFASNANTSAVITANSNLSKGLTLSGSDVNATALMSYLSDDNGSAGMTLNVGTLTTYISSVIGTSYDTVTNGNFTSGINNDNTSSHFAVRILLDVNDNNMTTSDRAFYINSNDKITIGEDVATGASGTQYGGYTVLDANLTD